MSVISSYSESDNTGGVFKRRRQTSCDENDVGIGIASTVLSPAIHIVPPCHDVTGNMTSREGRRRKRSVRDDDGSSPYDSSDTLQEDYDDDDDEMRDDATYVDYDDLGSDDEDENVVESVVDLSETRELMHAHVADELHQKSHLVRLWQSIAGRNGEREGPTSPLRYLAGWTNENRKRGHLAQKRRSVRASSSSSQAEDQFWTLNSKRRRSSAVTESPVDMASSNNDYILSRNLHWPASTSASDIGDVQRSPRRYSTESGLPRYYPGGWPTPPEENDEDVAMDIENDRRDVLISSELALDAQVMGPSVSEYFVLDGSDRPSVGDVAAATPASDDEYDDDEAEYFRDFGSLLQSLRDVANGCASSVSSPSSSAGVISPRRRPVVVIDYGNNKNNRDDDISGAGVDYDYCNLAPECEGTGMTVENDGFQIVVRDGPSLSSSPIEGCGVVARMPSSFSADST
ncbi:hypothetical protein V1506DRAFT_451447 [Lipomyces tetrasporus]